MKIQGIVVLSALALSSAAFAGHKDGHDKGQGPKFSVDVENICTVEFEDPVTGPGLFLKVASTIKDVSGDFDDPDTAPDAQVTVKEVKAQQFVQRDEPPKRKDWTQVGDTNKSLDRTVYINLCNSSPLSPDAKALNASIQVKVDDRYFNSRCDDDPDNNVYDPDTGKVLEEFDESIVLPPVDEDGNPINCPAP